VSTAEHTRCTLHAPTAGWVFKAIQALFVPVLF
jgi:hypothetical protein